MQAYKPRASAHLRIPHGVEAGRQALQREATCEGIKVGGQGGCQGLALARRHLRHLALMQHHAADLRWQERHGMEGGGQSPGGGGQPPGPLLTTRAPTIWQSKWRMPRTRRDASLTPANASGSRSSREDPAASRALSSPAAVHTAAVRAMHLLQPTRYQSCAAFLTHAGMTAAPPQTSHRKRICMLAAPTCERLELLVLECPHVRLQGIHLLQDGAVPEGRTRVPAEHQASNMRRGPLLWMRHEIAVARLLLRVSVSLGSPLTHLCSTRRLPQGALRICSSQCCGSRGALPAAVLLELVGGATGTCAWPSLPEELRVTGLPAPETRTCCSSRECGPL